QVFCIISVPLFVSPSFFFNDTATTEIYTLSLHDALPILRVDTVLRRVRLQPGGGVAHDGGDDQDHAVQLLLAPRRDPGRHLRHRSEEHTSELQSRSDLVCRLLLEKKKKENTKTYIL